MKNFEEPDNCDPVLQQTWKQFGPGEWCLFVNISGHGQCGKKRKKDI